MNQVTHSNIISAKRFVIQTRHGAEPWHNLTCFEFEPTLLKRERAMNAARNAMAAWSRQAMFNGHEFQIQEI